jgi:hypothetical protein
MKCVKAGFISVQSPACPTKPFHHWGAPLNSARINYISIPVNTGIELGMKFKKINAVHIGNFPVQNSMSIPGLAKMRIELTSMLPWSDRPE